MRTTSSAIKEREGLRNCCNQIVSDHRRAGNLRSSPVEPDGGTGCLKAGKPPRPKRSDHSRKHIARTCRRQPGRRNQRETEATVRTCDERVRPFIDNHRPRPPRCLEGPVSLRSLQLAEKALELAFVRREDGTLPAKPLRLTELRNRIRVDDLRRTGCKREREDLRDFAHDSCSTGTRT